MVVATHQYSQKTYMPQTYASPTVGPTHFKRRGARNDPITNYTGATLTEAANTTPKAGPHPRRWP